LGVYYLHNVNSTIVNKMGEPGRIYWDSAASTLANSTSNGVWDGGQGAVDGVQFQMSSGNIS
jgi:hypothetical protein